MEINILIAFWTVSFLFIITPGVDWAYAISAGIEGRVVVPAVTGLIFGHLTATLIVAAGVGSLVSNHPLSLTMLTTVGAGYLIWIGIHLVKAPPVASKNSGQLPRTGLNWLIKGACVSGLNPKVFLLFLALLPQFTDSKSKWPISFQMLTLGLIHIITCLIIYLTVGYSSQFILASRPTTAKKIGQFSGVLMVLIAIILLFEQVFIFKDVIDLYP